MGGLISIEVAGAGLEGKSKVLPVAFAGGGQPPNNNNPTTAAAAAPPFFSPSGRSTDNELVPGGV